MISEATERVLRSLDEAITALDLRMQVVYELASLDAGFLGEDVTADFISAVDRIRSSSAEYKSVMFEQGLPVVSIPERAPARSVDRPTDLEQADRMVENLPSAISDLRGAYDQIYAQHLQELPEHVGQHVYQMDIEGLISDLHTAMNGVSEVVATEQAGSQAFSADLPTPQMGDAPAPVVAEPTEASLRKEQGRGLGA